jgi:hypothetical protein
MKAKDLEVKISVKRLYIKIKGDKEPLIDGELDEKVKTEESFWSIEDGKFLKIDFEKAEERIWKTIVKGD